MTTKLQSGRRICLSCEPCTCVNRDLQAREPLPPPRLLRKPTPLPAWRPTALIAVPTLGAAVELLIWEGFPRAFPPHAHAFLAALPLTLVALSYLAYQVVRRPDPRELLRATLLAAAFLLWAANQFWPASPHATEFNDVAIALFCLDVVLFMVGWPKAAAGESSAETGRDTESPHLRPWGGRPERKPGTHVEPDLPVGQDVGPEQRCQPSLVGRCQDMRPGVVGEHVLEHQGVDVDQGGLQDAQAEH